MPQFPAYPNELLPAQWNSHKGLIAKLIKGETGLTALLTDCQTWYQTSERLVNDIVKNRERDAHLVAGLWRDLNNLHKIMLKRALDKLQMKAIETAVEWRPQTCPVPRGTRKYVETIGNKAMQLRAECTRFFEAMANEME